MLLGSAVGDLLRQRAESLAGRIGYVELTPLLASELPRTAKDLGALQHLWLRGGFLRSVDAASDVQSSGWRQDFIHSLLQRDLRSWSVSVSADNLHRFWRMLAHLQGQLFHVAALMPAGARLCFYRTAAGTELDTVVEYGDRRVGIEVKFSSAPKPARGFWQALDDLGIAQAYVIAPVAHAYPLAANVDVLPLTQLTTQLLDG